MQAQLSVFQRAQERLAARDRERLSLKALMVGAETLDAAMLAHERKIIFEAMRLAGGQLTKAAPMLGLTYQGLGYILDARHPDLRHKPKVIRCRARS